jgi:hypothetical protein
MKSEVELTPGFSRSMRTTETPVAFAITAYVSPARTTQNRGVEVPVVAATPEGAGVPPLPDSKPARIKTTATVAASRNAAGAA